MHKYSVAKTPPGQHRLLVSRLKGDVPIRVRAQCHSHPLNGEALPNISVSWGYPPPSIGDRPLPPLA